MSQFTVKAKMKFGAAPIQEFSVTQNGVITTQAEAEAHVKRHHPYLTVIPLAGDDLKAADAKAGEWWANRAPAMQEQKPDVPAAVPVAPVVTPAPVPASSDVHPASLA